MLSFKPSSRPGIPWFSLGIGAIFLGSLALRFWGLSRFNTLVFDEVYYVKNANHYLTQTPFFDSHPPLSKYLIAIGIWLSNTFHWAPNAPQNALAGSSLSTFSYRWLNALLGAFVPLVLMAIAHHLTRRRTYVLLVGLFAAVDGLFLVESRYGLNNIYLVLFGLLGHWGLLMALDNSHRRRPGWMLLAGISFGASASIKWNGLWFLLGAYLIWAFAWAMEFWHRGTDPPPPAAAPTTRLPLQRLTELNLPEMLIYLGILPFVVYYLLWIPHLQLNVGTGFWQLQQEILDFHHRVGGNAPSVHPYCSPWYTWIWMLRPVVYFYETALRPTDLVPLRPSLPAGAARVIFDVHAMGNPILWWISTLAMLFLVGTLLTWKLNHWTRQSTTEVSYPLLLTVYLVVNYAANLLPWVRVTRCTFLYHYMGSAVFALLAIAWLIDRWLSSQEQGHRVLAVTLIFLTLLAFVFWLPLYLGLPLSPTDLQLRRWLPTW